MNPYRGKIRSGGDVTAVMSRVNSLEATVRVPTGDPSSPDGVLTKVWQHNLAPTSYDMYNWSAYYFNNPFGSSPEAMFNFNIADNLVGYFYAVGTRTETPTVDVEDNHYCTVELVPTAWTNKSLHIIGPSPGYTITEGPPDHPSGQRPARYRMLVKIYSDESLIYSGSFDLGSFLQTITRPNQSGQLISGTQIVPQGPARIAAAYTEAFGGNILRFWPPAYRWVDSLSTFALYLDMTPPTGNFGPAGTTLDSISGTSQGRYMRITPSGATWSDTPFPEISHTAGTRLLGSAAYAPTGNVTLFEDGLFSIAFGWPALQAEFDAAPLQWRFAYFTQGTTSGTKPLDPTEWDKFLRDQTRESIGTFPPLEALTYTELPPADTDALVCPDTLTQIRDAIEAIAEYFENPGTGNPYNWTDASADNLYFVACGDRTQFGAQGGARYTWTRSAADMLGTPTFDIDIAEIDACVTQLEGSALV